MRKTDINVQELVDMIHRGELRLPEMQRQFVWKSTRVRDLLDSLYRGYPSGTILVWETDAPMPTRDLAVEQVQSPFSGHKLLLDGQQRLTSLSAVIRGEPVKVRNRKKPIDVLFNLEHPEKVVEAIGYVDDGSDPDHDEVELPAAEDEIAPVDDSEDEAHDDDGGVVDEVEARMQDMTFVVSSKKLARHPNWVSVTRVFKTESIIPIIEEAGVTDWKDPRFKKYSERLERLRSIKNYQFTMQVVGPDLSYEEVTEIFVRVNSLGAKLRGSDLALAQITATWRNSLKLFEAFQKECAERDQFDIPLGILIRSLVVFATNQGRFHTVRKISEEELRGGWEDTKKAINFAIAFLKNNAGIESPVLLSSPLFVVIVAYLAFKKGFNFSKEHENQLLYWLHVANGTGHYSGSTETKLDQDLAAIRTDPDPAHLLKNLRAWGGDAEFTPEAFAGKNQRSPLFKLMFIALKANDAKDWHTALTISVTLRGNNHRLQFHHIHPKATLKGNYKDREINEIANLSFVCGTTNRRIGRKSPSEYFLNIIKQRGEDAFASQCIPLDKHLLSADGYLEFLEKRRTLLCDVVNGFLANLRS